jgi:myo-inositol 2-dehydrogenase/D-chiro-inositol 1-dehydrogenase
MKKQKIAVAGLGRIGRIHLDNLCRKIQGVEVIGAMEVAEEFRKVTDPYGIPFFTRHFEELIGLKELDAVVICSPTDTHAEYVSLSAEAGKHVFCEKPLDLKLERVKEVLRKVDDHGIAFMLGFNRRFDPDFRKVHDMVRRNILGDLHIIKITSRDPGPPPVEYIKRSGGLFLDMTIHDFDMARYISGKTVKEVYARGGVFVDPAIRITGDIDTAVITITFEDDSLAVIDNSRKAVYGYDQRLEVFGSKGMVQADNNFEDHHRLYSEKNISGALPLHFFLERYEKSYVNEMQEFVDALNRKKKMPVGGEDGLISLKMGLAAKKSLEENRPVKLSEIDA